MITTDRPFTNNPDILFNDISLEIYREYVWPNGSLVRIEAPQGLAVSASGGHRVVDGKGISHYVPSGWIHLRWENSPGAAAFQF